MHEMKNVTEGGLYMKKMSYTIKDELGIHARPAGELVKIAKGFNSDVKICIANKEADAKRIFSVMGLAVKQGQKVEIIAEGTDEEKAIEELEEFFENNL